MTPDRCPGCGAACRPDAQWCTLCYADFRPPPPGPVHAAPISEPAVEPGVEPAAPPSVEPPAYAGQVAVLDRPRRGRHAAPSTDDYDDDDDDDATVRAAWPCSHCSATTPMERSSCDGCGLPFLAALHADRPAVRLPGIGDVTQASRVVRLGLAAAAALVAIAVLVGLLTLVGLLF